MANKDISPLLIIGIIAFLALAFYFSRGGTTFSTVGLSGSSCSDSDSGLDIFWKGTINGGLSNTEQVIATPQYDECQSTTKLIEMYCDSDGYRKAMLLSCPEGESCVDGACTGGVPGGAK